ncbi:outer membrane lipoprotein carrier protein LolA [Amycolatopsis sp. NPDC049868]|uniref:outer membrane lipoprotein carrier protein LolA n=1 Tax=Amycolatopsis sp. NPDC049868 TaxID=3363934 RepID=UPI003790B6DB
MDPKRKAITAAVVGTALGVGGLAVVAMPATAGDAPVLPQISAEELVQSTLNAKPSAFDGKVKVSNDLGLPQVGSTLPGVSALNVDSAQISTDGAGKSKVSLTEGSSQQTIVQNGQTVWEYSSKDNSATKVTIPDGLAKEHQEKGKNVDPATVASELLGKVRESSTIAVSGTASVANRSAYELVLTPKPTERTLLREIRVAIDDQTRLPLRVTVLANGTSSPALEVSFSEINFAAQPASNFEFTPPKGAKVTEKTAEVGPEDRELAEQAKSDLKVVGDGWDTAITGKVPADALAKAGQAKDEEGRQVDPKALLSRFAKPVSGAWGSGWLVTTKVGSGVLTDDGRYAVGAVPEQVLFEALAAK